MSDAQNNKKVTINLRELDDVSCTNVVTARQIRRLVKKFPTMEHTDIDCWVHGGHYIKFKSGDNRFTWYCDIKEPHFEGCEKIKSDDSELSVNELNKLIVHTYRSMCDVLNGTDISDTPEDILAFAEMRLQELLHDENRSEQITNKALEAVADSMVMSSVNN